MDTRIRGVCLDLWNTLVTTVHDPHPLAALAEAFGLTGSPRWRRTIEEAMMTKPLPGISAALDELERATGRRPSHGWTRRSLVLMWGAACNNNRPFPDVPDALARMARLKLRLGIVSNTQSFDLDVLRREGLFPWIHTLCLSCDHGCLKPDPRLFLEAARQMELPPGEILMIGDQIDDDVRGARAAGMRAALLDRCPEKDRRARAVAIPSGEIAIHGLDELAGRLERNDPFIASS